MNILLLLFIIFLLYFIISYLVGRPHPQFPPGPLRWPIWGSYLQLLVENYRFPYKAMHWMARRYNTEVLGMYLGDFPTVVACSYDSVRELLLKPEFQGRVEGIISRIRDSDGVIRGQFFIDGPNWTEQRRFMLRTLRDFGFGTRNQHFEGIIEEEVRDFIDVVQCNIKGVCHNGIVEVPSVFYPIFLNLSLELLLGKRLPRPLHYRLREFASKALSFQKALDPTTGAINMTPWVRHIAPHLSGYTDCIESNNFMKNFILEIVEEHKDSFMVDHLRDFCDVYIKEIAEKESLDSEHWFTEKQLVMTLWDLLFATSMTLTATMTFSIEFLLHHPEVQTNVQREIDQVVGRSRLPTLDDRKNMPYTEAVLREVMRRETVVALALPHRCTQDTYFYGYFIPKDTVLMANLWSCQMDHRIWKNPFEFNPRRHLDNNGNLKKKDMTMPFGLGKRVCSAETYARQNSFLVFSAMMQHFCLELPHGKPLPDLEKHVPGVNLSPQPFQVVMVPR